MTGILIFIDVAGSGPGAEKCLALCKVRFARTLELVEYIFRDSLDIGRSQRAVRFRRHLRGSKLGFLQSVAVSIAVGIFLKMGHACRETTAAYGLLDLVETQRGLPQIGSRAAVAAAAGARPFVAPHAVCRLEYT